MSEQQKQFKDIVLDIEQLNNWYKEKLEWDYQEMSMKEKVEFLKLSNELRDKVMQMQDILDKIEDIPYSTEE